MAHVLELSRFGPEASCSSALLATARGRLCREDVVKDFLRELDVAGKLLHPLLARLLLVELLALPVEARHLDEDVFSDGTYSRLRVR